MEHTETGYFLQQVYTSLAQDLQMQTFNTTAMSSMYVNPQNIDRMVEMEMKRIKENCTRKEQQYVEQMLLENPITIERRINNNGTITTTSNSSSISTNHNNSYQQQHSEEDVDVVSVSTSTKHDSYAFLQQQRAEACRRSRYNNKIKKAKSKYRHKYMSQKLLQSTQMFDCIQDLIQQAENHLLTQGLTKDKLHHLRHSYGVDTATDNVRKLEHIMKIEK